jgi:hypothetical protein
MHADGNGTYSCASAPPAPPDVPPLDTDACTAQFADVTTACCTPAKYCSGPTGIPNRCTASCVDPYLLRPITIV